MGISASPQAFIYGEVDFSSIAVILRQAVAYCTTSSDDGLYFYDLGSGTGRAVFAV